MTDRLSDQEIVETFLYVVARYLVIRQQRIDLDEDGVGYNLIKYNELGKAEFVNPNMDVAYLEAWIAVDEHTPAVLSVPRIEGRYYTAQICDEWADIVVNINERNFPDHPFGEFALCLTGSSPEIPDSAVRIDLPSRKAKLLARVERQGDDATAIELQRAFSLRSLGEPSVEPPVNVPMFTNAAPITVEAFERPLVDQVLESAPDGMPSAIEWQRRVQAVADYVGASHEHRREVDRIISAQAWPGLAAWIKGFGDRRGGWSATTGKPDGFGDDIWFRAAANFGGIWWNNNREVVYFIGEQDADGHELDGTTATSSTTDRVTRPTTTSTPTGHSP